MESDRNDNNITGRVLYRDGIDFFLIGAICFFVLSAIVIPLTGLGKNIPFFRLILLSPLVLLSLVNRIQVFYSFDNGILLKKIWKCTFRKFELSKPCTIYYLNTKAGCAFLIEKQDGRSIKDCKSLFGVLVYLLMNRKSSLLIPFKSGNKDEYVYFFEKHFNRFVIIKGGFLKLISSRESL
jgi:hypothetical protein